MIYLHYFSFSFPPFRSSPWSPLCPLFSSYGCYNTCECVYLHIHASLGTGPSVGVFFPEKVYFSSSQPFLVACNSLLLFLGDWAKTAPNSYAFLPQKSGLIPFLSTLFSPSAGHTGWCCWAWLYPGAGIWRQVLTLFQQGTSPTAISPRLRDTRIFYTIIIYSQSLFTMIIYTIIIYLVARYSEQSSVVDPEKEESQKAQN